MNSNTVYISLASSGLLIMLLALICCKSLKEENLNVKVKEKGNRIHLVRQDEQQMVDVFINNELFTSYRYPETLKKPVLYPLITPAGTKITRNYPLEFSTGERTDHPHHVGLWFNYGDVNALDFWNNSNAVKPDKRQGYGTIVHKEILNIQSGENEGSLEVSMDWITPGGVVLIKEYTRFIFRVEGAEYSIDRITKLSARVEEVRFKDNKEGLLGIRVTRALEHPSKKPAIFSNSDGMPGEEKTVNNDGVTGNYINSNGIEGIECWGKRANWVNLSAQVSDEAISLAILDHPANIGYPTYWHARGYGLFAANPLGQEVFSNGVEKLDLKLKKGESIVFKHRIIVTSKILNSEYLDKRFEQFSKE